MTRTSPQWFTSKKNLIHTAGDYEKLLWFLRVRISFSLFIIDFLMNDFGKYSISVIDSRGDW